MAVNRGKSTDPYHEAERDLVNLDGIDLAYLDFDTAIAESTNAPKASPWKLGGAFAAIALIAAINIWLPNTDFYRAHGENSWVFWLVSSSSILAGFALGRFLWRWAEEAAERAARERAEHPERAKTAEPPSKWMRFATLAAAVGGGATLLYNSNQEGMTSGLGYFGAAIGAIVTGILAGRWLLMQAEAAPKRRAEEITPFVLPAWFKWVTLGVLFLCGLFAGFGDQLLPGSDSESLRFAMGGIAFIVGIGGAIWLARRFEELEEKFRNEKPRR